MTAPRYDLAEIKARLPLSDLIGRDVTWDMRRSNARRRDWWAPCPFHDERTPSFHVDDGKGFYHCFGCGAKGDHVDWAQERLGAAGFLEAVAILAGIAGVGPMVDHARPVAREVRRDRREAAQSRAAARRLEDAAAIWRQSRPGPEPVLMSYLAARGVDVAVLLQVWGGPPPSLRFHPDLPYFEQGTGREMWRGPAMVARIGRERGVGVHRTWITPHGRQTVAGRKLDKRWLGRTGSMMGRPVVLGTPGARRMLVGEGIESVLAPWSRLTRDYLRGEGPPWAAEAAISLGALTGAGDPAFRGPHLNRRGSPLASPVPDWSRPAWLAPDDVDELVILVEGSAKDGEEIERRYRCAHHRHRLLTNGGARGACRLALPGGDQFRWDREWDWADECALQARAERARSA